jgi:hypothetical protein
LGQPVEDVESFGSYKVLLFIDSLFCLQTVHDMADLERIAVKKCEALPFVKDNEPKVPE